MEIFKNLSNHMQNLKNKLTGFLAFVWVGLMGAIFLVAPMPVRAANTPTCGADQTCKHPCAVGTEFDTGTICNNDGWTCCEKVKEVNLTPTVNTTADCLAKKGQCITWGDTCPNGLLQSATCDDATPVQTCCTPQTGPSTAGPSGLGSLTTLIDPLGGATINGLIGRFISVFLGFVGAIALLVFVYAGIMYMTGGSSDRIKKAIDTMKYAVLGLMIIMFAYAITTFYFKALTSDTGPQTAAPKNVALPTQ